MAWIQLEWRAPPEDVVLLKQSIIQHIPSAYFRCIDRHLRFETASSILVMFVHAPHAKSILEQPAIMYVALPGIIHRLTCTAIFPNDHLLALQDVYTSKETVLFNPIPGSSRFLENYSAYRMRLIALSHLSYRSNCRMSNLGKKIMVIRICPKHS